MKTTLTRRRFLARSAAALSTAALPVNFACAANTLVLRKVIPMSGPMVDVLITDDRITEVGPNLSIPVGAAVEDCDGALLVPGFVESHAHLDKTVLGMDWFVNTGSKSLLDIIEKERGLKRSLNIDPARQSARQLVHCSRLGTTHIRTHADVDTDLGLWSVEGVVKTREAYKDLVDMELVAFPQSGLLRRPGTVALMEDALRMGVEIVGGLDPCGIDKDPKGTLDALFRLCNRFDKPMDIHLHERGELGAFSMGLIFDRVRALGMQGQVTISHAFCLGQDNQRTVDRLIENLAELDIAITTVGYAWAPAPPLLAMREAGIRVASGSDGIRDTWGPYGSADMLEKAMILGQRYGLNQDKQVEMALDVCTYGGASLMRLEDYGITPGCKADLVVVPARNQTEAVVTVPTRQLVLKDGTIVAREGVSTRKAP